MTLSVECPRASCDALITTTKVRFGSLNRALYRNVRAHLEHIHGLSGRAANTEAERAVSKAAVLMAEEGG